MLFRYIEMNDGWDRDGAECLQAETVEDGYAERIRAIKACGQVLCKDGLVRDVLSIEYSPPNGAKSCASVEIYLAEV